MIGLLLDALLLSPRRDADRRGLRRLDPIGQDADGRGRSGSVPTLHRFCVERSGFGGTAATVRVADGENPDEVNRQIVGFLATWPTSPPPPLDNPAPGR